MKKTLKNYINAWQNAPLNIARFQGKPMPQTPDEESLFNAMIDYFKSRPFAVVVSADKTHHHNVSKTHHHNVRYKPLPPYDTSWGPSVEKEISDVFFLVFSPSRRIARMTHLQAKLEDRKKPGNAFSFTLDAGQYHMLHNRLEINDSKGVFPNDILSFPLYSDSVSSYGVFYLDEKNEYDMAFEIASLISYSGRKSYKSPNAALVHTFATTADLWGDCNLKTSQLSAPFWHCCRFCYMRFCEDCCRELLSTIQIDHFERELLDMHVGTRMEFDVTTLRQLAGLFVANHKAATYTSFVSRMEKIVQEYELLDEINQYHRNRKDDVPPRVDNSGESNSENLGGTYILINADEAENYNE